MSKTTILLGALFGLAVLVPPLNSQQHELSPRIEFEPPKIQFEPMHQFDSLRPRRVSTSLRHSQA